MAWVIFPCHHARRRTDGHSMNRSENEAHRLTADALANVPTSQTSQLHAWQAQQESHERLAAAGREEKRKRTKATKRNTQKRIEQFFEDIDIDKKGGDDHQDETE